MSNLIGTEKQVAWAESIRDSKFNGAAIDTIWDEFETLTREFLTCITNESEELFKADIHRAVERATIELEEAIVKLQNSTSAVAWIETRNLTLRAMLDGVIARLGFKKMLDNKVKRMQEDARAIRNNR